MNPTTQDPETQFKERYHLHRDYDLNVAIGNALPDSLDPRIVGIRSNETGLALIVRDANHRTSIEVAAEAILEPSRTYVGQ
jgi:hypothetical protein